MNKVLSNYLELFDVNYHYKNKQEIVEIFKNLPYLFKLRNSLYFVDKENDFTHIFFIDSFDFAKFYLTKFRNKSVKYCQFIGPSVFIWKERKAKFINLYFDHIFSIFEVERKFYDKNKYSYIGHPIYIHAQRGLLILYHTYWPRKI